MMTQAVIEELYVGNFAIVCVAAWICIIMAVSCLAAYNNDIAEIASVTDVVYFQEDIKPRDPVYIVTLKIEDCYVFSGHTDLIFRLRGSVKDSPLVLFRDYDGGYLAPDKTLNLGFSLPFDLGSVVEIDIASDNSDFDEGMSVLTFSDLFIRKLPRKADALANSKTQMMLKNNDSPFEALSKNVKTWTSTETLTNSKGVRVLGVSLLEVGKSHTVRARDMALSLSIKEETETLKTQTRIGFRPLHYIWSQGISWHTEWSEYSQLDHAMVMWLDLLATLVVISCSYAYGVEKFLGVTILTPLLTPLTADVKDAATTVEEFDLMNLFSNFNLYLVPLITIVYVAIITSTFIIPLSLMWCRLFRLIGGKGFEKALECAQPPSKEGDSRSKASLHLGLEKAPPVSARQDSNNKDEHFADDLRQGSTLMLRTLECKSTHTASCVTSSRRLRMEPLLSNCLADHITARSVAYIRTKMAKLRDEKILSGQSGLKHPDVLHESHTQSTDAPQMPPPSSAPDGSGDVVRISRYCERLVQQAVRHIRDNSVIAECFEVSPHIDDAADVPGNRPDKFAQCCPRRCCGMTGHPDESISNLTFFTEEDALSLQEMVDHLPSPSSSKQKFFKSPWPPAGVSSPEEVLNNGESESYYDPLPTPLPSAKLKKSALKKLSLKNIRETVAKKVYGSRGDSGDTGTSFHSRRGRGLQFLYPPKNPETNTSERSSKKKGVRFEEERENKNHNRQHRARPNEKIFSRGFDSLNHSREITEKGIARKSRPGTKNSGAPASTPFPSSRSEVFYDPVAGSNDHYDWASAKSHFDDDEPLPDSAPFKGNFVKICVFSVLLLLQIGEIYFVTLFEMKENKFFTRNIDGSPGPGAGRMHSALLSCVIAIVWYPLFTVHMIALLSYFVDHIVQQLSDNNETYFETDSVGSRHSLAALP